MENEGLFTNMQEKYIVQVTGTIIFIQISNTNRQQFTSNNSNSTFDSAQPTGFAAHTADETPKSFQSINTLLNTILSIPLASNNLLARATDRTPSRDSHSKGDLSRSTRSSRSTFTPP
ncbi:hypothetical protein AVEN_184308-1 [Araneus ventricosus]|uniref:Uncharacterized protein n=1 Tax=Araneus ventricosus TaxID=182803 RepID=A0A4Y2K2Z3_ARAVE|nr:hypothetical protein AVEN_184308-1 [Araneus ventricosus]